MADLLNDPALGLGVRDEGWMDEVDLGMPEGA